MFDKAQKIFPAVHAIEDCNDLRDLDYFYLTDVLLYASEKDLDRLASGLPAKRVRRIVKKAAVLKALHNIFAQARKLAIVHI